jgi:hypothetical protein
MERSILRPRVEWMIGRGPAHLLKYIHTVRPSNTMVMIQREESFIPVFFDMTRILSPSASQKKEIIRIRRIN